MNYEFEIKMNSKLEYYRCNNVVIALGSTSVFSAASAACH